MASILSMVVTPPFEPSTSPKTSFKSSSSSLSHLLCSSCTSSLKFKAFNLSSSFNSRRILRDVKIKAQESEVSVAADTFTHFKHLLLPITDRNPYLSEGTRQLLMTSQKSRTLSMIHNWLPFAGICLKEFRLLEKLGEGSKPTAIIGEVADDMSLDLVVLSMEAIHSKHVDANLLAEFIPCPVLLLPL
ncbi:Imidazole glycerol phosphate synthase subunit HisH [Bienertia sinuspersici]